MTLAPWPIFDVTVDGFPSFPITARSRGKALAAALSSYQNYDDRMGMRGFMSIARVRRRREPLQVDGYDYVRRAYGLKLQIGQQGTLCREGPGFNGRRVTVLYPNRQSTAHVHVVDETGRRFIVHPFSILLDGVEPADGSLEIQSARPVEISTACPRAPAKQPRR